MDFLRLPPALRTNLHTYLRHHHHPLRPLSTLPTPPTPQPPPPPLPTLTPSTLNSYTTTHPPTPPQLKHASTFFQRSPPTLLYTAHAFRSLPPSPHPEIAFLGRSNVGKSSLLNALFNRSSDRIAYVSKKPGKTRTMNGFGIGGAGMGRAPLENERDVAWKRFGRGGVVVVDMPGYGGGSREEWGREAMKFLEQRRQLRRTFLCVDAEHGLKKSDVELLRHFRRQGVAYTVVLSKVDKILFSGAKAPGAMKLANSLERLGRVCEGVREELRVAFDDGREVRDDILCCSAEKSLDEKSGWRVKMGIDELRFAVLSSCGLESDEMGLPRTKLRLKDIAREEADD